MGLKVGHDEKEMVNKCTPKKHKHSKHRTVETPVETHRQTITKGVKNSTFSSVKDDNRNETDETPAKI
jgi:hypothetical protein